jgi:peptide/nickel transport system permease protein
MELSIDLESSQPPPYLGLRLWQDKLFLSGLIFVAVLVLTSIFAGWITRYDPNTQGDLLTSRYLPPSWEHPFGTDKFGRDVFSRVVYGSRISLSIATGVVLLTMTIGLVCGTCSGYLGGLPDAMMMRFLDFLLAFPAIFLIIIVIALFHPSHWWLIPILSLTGWMEMARIVRAEVLSLKESDFILAAKGLGLRTSRIIFRHLVPNCLTPVIVAVPLKVGEIILLESALSFLGIGVQPPTPSWGNIINDGREALLHAWWVSAFPGILILLTVMSFNLIGDGIRLRFFSRE